MVCVWERERLLSSLCLDASKQHWISPLRPLQLIKTPRHPSTLTRTTHKHNPCHAHHIQRKGTLNVHAARTSSEQATNEVKSLSASSVTPTTRARARSPRPDLRHTAQSERVIARARHIQKTMLLRRSSGAAALATTAAPTPRARAVVLVAPPTAARSTSSSRSAPSPSPAAPSCRRGDAAVAHARYRGGGGGGGGYFPTPSASSPSVADRLIAAVPWLLPLLDAFSYGRFLFYQYPLAARAVAPLAPLVSLYASVPFAPLVCFFGLYLGVVNNARVARFAPRTRLGTQGIHHGAKLHLGAGGGDGGVRHRERAVGQSGARAVCGRGGGRADCALRTRERGGVFVWRVLLVAPIFLCN